MAGTCAADGGGGGSGGAGEFMLFGVRVVVDSMRKSVSLNNLSQYEQPHHHQESPKEDLTASGYASADDAVHRASGSRSERRRGVPWTEEEHKLFLLGLQKVGKGDWRGISRNFVKTRTPTQVASHAQKYFLRQSNHNRRRRRTSLFDITTDAVTESQVNNNNATSQAHPLLSSSETSNISNFTANNNPVLLPIQIESPVENLSLRRANQAIGPTTNLIRPISSIPAATLTSTVHDFDLNLKSTDDLSPLSLKLSTSFNNGDNIIIVA